MGCADCVSVPRRIVLAGDVYRAAPLRIVDLARLERLALDAAGDPLDRLRDATAEDYDSRLKAAYDAAEGDGSPPDWSDTPEGLTAMVRAVLRHHRPRLNAVEALDLAARLDGDDWAALCRVAFGSDPLEALQRLVDRAAGVPELPPDGGGVPWREVVADMCVTLHKTPAEVAPMTPAEIGLVRSGGKPGPGPGDKPKSMSWERFERDVQVRRRAWWKGEAYPAAGSAPG
jgi:hypothetical protein